MRTRKRDSNCAAPPAARIKKSKKSQQTKFKVRCQRLLYTLVVKDADRADKLKQSLPPSMRPLSPPTFHLTMVP